jgi:hypothetical protein
MNGRPTSKPFVRDTGVHHVNRKQPFLTSSVPSAAITANTPSNFSIGELDGANRSAPADLTTGLRHARMVFDAGLFRFLPGS